ncbi:MAG: hypothetical protein J0M02_12980, partial [Planctomycetes bacterium]|nr:hypothetical protein [Planctomycetota bacterium]
IEPAPVEPAATERRPAPPTPPAPVPAASSASSSGWMAWLLLPLAAVAAAILWRRRQRQAVADVAADGGGKRITWAR